MIAAPAYAATGLFSDGFESGNFTNWTTASSTQWTVVNSAGGAHMGSKRAKVTGALADDYLLHAVSTSGYDTLTLTYWYDTDSGKGIESPDDFRAQWSTDGSTWNLISGSATSTLTNNTWQQNIFSLPSGADNNAGFRFRFLANLNSSSSDTFNIEDIELSGTAIATSTSTTTPSSDTIPPVIASHADITGVEATSEDGAVVVYTPPDATDNVDATAPATCAPASGSTFDLGTTEVECNKTDSSGNVATSTSFFVEVVDTTDPVIALDGSDPQTILVGDPYTELGATVTDNYDAGLSAIIDEGDVDTDTLGTYSVTYNATDGSGNVADEKVRTVEVVDQEAPIVTLLGANPQIIEVHGSYAELGADVSDNYDSGLTAVIDTSALDLDTVGSYSVTYDAEDFSANAADQETRTVNVVDTTAPTIALVGSAAITLERGTSYTDDGAIASDNYDADAPVGASDSVDTNTVGVYMLHYSHTDANGNAAFEVTRAVTVIDTVPDQFTFLDQTTDGTHSPISNTIIVLDISTATAISVTGGTYSVGGGAYTDAPGTVSRGDQVSVQHDNPGDGQSTQNTTLTIGGVSDTFTTTAVSTSSGGGSSSNAPRHLPAPSPEGTVGQIVETDTSREGQIAGLQLQLIELLKQLLLSLQEQQS
jgi:hypothetical protein